MHFFALNIFIFLRKNLSILRKFFISFYYFCNNSEKRQNPLGHITRMRGSNFPQI